MNQTFFLRTFFHSALSILEPQTYIVAEQFGAENISLLRGRLVLKTNYDRTNEILIESLETIAEKLSSFQKFLF